MNGTGGKYTRSRLPVILVYHEEHCSRSKAMRREWELKQLDHQTKHNLAKAFNNRSIG
jgi:putative endonuclease